ncbi:NDMA-dependent alcohol dehydrogenase [Trujillonella endophytica]|uniref:S-(Hydroxymethyl)glutathione dehydrogenase / alcohol dehydrogenase n=1 Tax=Trujillonella endophytica TaxID=673521 RepID=A0A1H8QKJ8_9ACTN|nr:NDMA-dependent alcohol dehydrogenase [Trujillella endophytica]SEO54765.1 S-(hydroxymethyl)glutathione dehydrogenase / alcohol dehydrogenase [Trujillella endophytica]
MRTRAAVLFAQPGKWEVTELELQGPQQGELLIRMGAAGLCHSDDHLATGDLPVPPEAFPMAGGHEGAGTVVEVGRDTPGWTVGDRVALSFIPACGFCRWCASGMHNLCDDGLRGLSGARDGGSLRTTLDGRPVGGASATFSELSTVSARLAVKIPDDVPLDVASLTSCGVVTGWGSAVRSADVGPGDVVVVMGVGGIGMNAVQGAAHAGASVLIAVDPVESKRASALDFGATHAVATMEEAGEIAGSFTNGQGADSCIICVGVVTGEHIAAGVEVIRKAGTCVLTGLPRAQDDTSIPISSRHLTLFQKRIQGSLFGASSPAVEIPAVLELYRRGYLKLDELITRRYTLETINDGYADMRAGANIRGVVEFDAL